MRHFLLTCLLFVAASVSAGQSHTTIPAVFQGHWAMSADTCGIPHEMRLEIAPDSVRFWESAGPAISIVTRGEEELAMIVEFSGEGEQWLGFVHFRLSADRTRLSDLSDPYAENPVVRVRCPVE